MLPTLLGLRVKHQPEGRTRTGKLSSGTIMHLLMQLRNIYELFLHLVLASYKVSTKQHHKLAGQG